MITLLLEAREEKQLTRLQKQLAQLDLLILDELGYLPTGKAGAELLFDVLTTAYERVSLIVTTNLPFEHWTEVLGSERPTLISSTLYPALHNSTDGRCTIHPAFTKTPDNGK